MALLNEMLTVLQVYHTNFWPLEWTVAKRPENSCYAKLICLIPEKVPVPKSVKRGDLRKVTVSPCLWEGKKMIHTHNINNRSTENE